MDLSIVPGAGLYLGSLICVASLLHPGTIYTTFLALGIYIVITYLPDSRPAHHAVLALRNHISSANLLNIGIAVSTALFQSCSVIVTALCDSISITTLRMGMSRNIGNNH